MAKNATVFYKLPIEQMRGKLATTQKGIVYAGQGEDEKPIDLETGKHLATNYSNFVVLSVRRGKNYFYVRSRTSIRNTTGTVFSRTSLSLGVLLADELYKWYKSGSIEMAAVKDSFDYWGGEKTFREYITSIVVEAVRGRKQEITYKSRPDEQGVSEIVDLISNPYYSFVTGPVTINNVVFGSTVAQAKILQQFMRFFAAAQDATAYNITVVNTVTGSRFKMYVNAQSDTLISSITGLGLEMYLVPRTSAEDPFVLRLVDYRGNVVLTGTPYTDAQKTTALAPTDVISQIGTLYV